MTRNELHNEYFEWMYHLVCDDEYSKKLSYRKLLEFLHEVEFYYIHPMDGNRAGDGINLRYRFGYECGYENAMIATYLDDQPCSVLEMIIALAVRCEEHLMCNSELGDRTGQWFWGMIVNLGLGGMSDTKFDESKASYIVHRFLEREYEPDGKGGLFTVPNDKRDMRDIEIWYQMNAYLITVLRGEGAWL